LMDSFKQALRATSELVASSQSSFTSPLLSPLLLTPLNNGFDFVLGPQAEDLDKKWGLDVYQAWHDKLEGHYPFVDNGADANVSDFAEFLKPDKGLLWAFYNESLHGLLQRDGDTFSPVPQN